MKLELEDGRPALEHFETATRRRGKRAGQRYRCFWQDEEGVVLDGLPGEVWFAGASWSHQAGATIVIELSEPAEIDEVKALPTVDRDDTVPRFFLGLVQVDDDEKPIDQRKAALVEWAEGLKGGPISKAAARRCQERDFQEFVAHRLKLPAGEIATVEQCDAWIKRACSIHTKRLLDYEHPTTGERFADRYQRFVQTPFISWTQRRPKKGEQA